jgi:hypothetical protein
MIWDQDSLWQKAKTYAARAFEEERESPTFPFWASLSLEFLARAALARLSPTLLADPQGPDNLLFALGIITTEKPKSVAITTVYSRCQLVVPGFTKDLANACTSLSERRNSELHSGDPAFDGVGTSIWLGQFYKSCKALLAYQGKTLEDYIPADEVEVAEEMISALDSRYRSEAQRTIGESKAEFEKLSDEERATRTSQARLLTELAAREPGAKGVNCPACGRDSALSGTRIKATQPILEDGELHWENIYLPSKLQCDSCGLKLDGYPILQGAGLGGQFAEMERADPAQFFSPIEEYFEEYNNM